MPSSIRLQAISSAIGVAALFMSLLAVLCAAPHAGLRISFELLPTLKAAGIAGVFALLAIRAQKLAPRVSMFAGSYLVLWGGGLAGGVLCMVAPMFNMPMIDPSLAAADKWLGLTSADVIRAVIAVPFAPKLLYAMYFPSVIILFLTALLLSALGRAERLAELCSAYAFCLAVATVCSVLLPASGAFEYLGLEPLFGAQLPPGSGVYHLEVLHTLRSATQLTINPFALHGLVTFPSFHTSMALMTAAAWRDDRFVKWPMFAWNALVIISTVPVGGHYIVDLIAGALTWFVVFRHGTRWAQALMNLRLRLTSRPALEAAS